MKGNFFSVNRTTFARETDSDDRNMCRRSTLRFFYTTFGYSRSHVVHGFQAIVGTSVNSEFLCIPVLIPAGEQDQRKLCCKLAVDGWVEGNESRSGFHFGEGMTAVCPDPMFESQIGGRRVRLPNNIPVTGWVVRQDPLCKGKRCFSSADYPDPGTSILRSGWLPGFHPTGCSFRAPY
jgi:hypothetical protein